MIGIGIGIAADFLKITSQQNGGGEWNSFLPLPPGLPDVENAKTDIVFCLVKINGDNFIDGVNGWEFPITNKDWEDDEATWIGDATILPFKTVATLSAPANGEAKTAIQAADVNNFWYASDGTPNQIPVQSFFQNIDFANRAFCGHVEHEINDDLEEIKPAGVKYITLYKTDRTVDSSFTDFFGNEVELPVGDVLFVSKSGDDTIGDGSFNKPFQTIYKGITTLPDGHTLWVLSGEYNETGQVGATSYNYLRWRRHNVILNIKCAGNVELQSTDATYVYYKEGVDAKTNITGLRFQGKTVYNGGAFPGLYERVTFLSGSTMGNGIAATVKYCTMNGTFTTAAGAAVFTECYTLNGVVTVNNNLNTTSITYCKIKTTSGNNNVGIAYGVQLLGGEIKYCFFDLKGTGRALQITNTFMRSFAHLCTIERNIFKSIKGIHCYPSDISATSTFKVVIKYNKFICKEFGVSLSGSLFETSEITYNYFHCVVEDSATASCININPTGINVPFKINYNRLFTENKTGLIITFGEGSGGQMDGTEIIGNYFRGHLFNRPTEYGNCHGLLNNGGVNFIIMYNKFAWLPVGCVVKANGGLEYTGGGVVYNVFYNNEQHMSIRRVNGLNTLNNTFKSALITSTRISRIDAQSYSCYGEVFQNNIFEATSNNMFNIADSALGGIDDVVFDNNIFPVGNDGVIYNLDTTDVMNYSQAAAAGYVVNGEQAEPVFNNIDDGELWLQAGSPGRGDGSDLGVDYEDGLDITTDWNENHEDDDPDNYPVIVTKKQGVSWDKGAYVY